MKLKVTLSIGMIGRQEDILDIDGSDIEGMTQEEIDAYCEEAWLEWRSNYLDGSWEIVG